MNSTMKYCKNFCKCHNVCYCYYYYYYYWTNVGEDTEETGALYTVGM
jgi:hypothetical protein